MSTSTDFKTLEIPVDGVNSYIPPIIINEADNDGRNLKFIPLQDGQPVTGFTSSRLYYDPRPKDAYSVGGYIDGTQDGDGWTFVIPANTFTADMQGNGSVSFTDSDGETYTRNIQFLVESGGTKALSQGSKIDQLVALLQSMVNDFTMTAEAETGEAGSQANVTATRMNGGAYNLKFVIPRGDKGDTGDAATIQLGKVITGNPGTNAEITNSGTENNAVFNFTIPRGDVGPAGVNENVPLGSTSGVVAQASYVYPALPRKVQVHGRTIENLWPKYSRTLNGITLTCDSSGLFHISGTATAATYIAEDFNSGKIQTNTRYTILYAGDTTGLQQHDWGVYANLHGKPLRAQNNTGVSGTSGTDGLNNANVYVGAGVSIDRYFRVMLVEGDTVPDVFVPAGVHTVKPTKLEAVGKNLIYGWEAGSLDSDTGNKIDKDNEVRSSPSRVIPGMQYTLTVYKPSGLNKIRWYGFDGTYLGFALVSNLELNVVKSTVFTAPENVGSIRFVFTNTDTNKFTNMLPNMDSVVQLESGSKSTQWSLGQITETNLPSDISLANGDTLTIDRGGTTQILHAEGEPTVLENVSLPELPAPTFNVYTVGGYVPPTVDVDYEQDVNLVLQALEAKIAALQVADKTN